MDRKEQLQQDRDKIIAKIKKEQAKLKKIDEELKGIAIQERLNDMDKVSELLKAKGVKDITEFIELVQSGKVNINK